MQLTVKTLKGGKFTIEVEASNTVAEAKAVIVSVSIPHHFYSFLLLFAQLIPNDNKHNNLTQYYNESTNTQQWRQQ